MVWIGGVGHSQAQCPEARWKVGIGCEVKAGSAGVSGGEDPCFHFIPMVICLVIRSFFSVTSGCVEMEIPCLPMRGRHTR